MQDNCRYKWRYSPIRHKVFMGGPPIRQPISSRLKASFCSLSNIIFFFDEFWNIPGDLLKIPGTYKGSFKGSRPFPAMNVQNYAIYYFSGMFPKERYIKASYFAAITVDQTPARAKNVNKAGWTGDEHWTLVKKGDLKEKTSYYYLTIYFLDELEQWTLGERANILKRCALTIEQFVHRWLESDLREYMVTIYSIKWQELQPILNNDDRAIIAILWYF